MFINQSYLLLLSVVRAKSRAAAGHVKILVAMLEKMATMLSFLSPCYQKWPPC